MEGPTIHFVSSSGSMEESTNRGVTVLEGEGEVELGSTPDPRGD
jgi:hypothetical protein